MRFLADENLKRALVNGLLRRLPDLDIVRVQETEVYQAPDPIVLEWAAEHSCIVITHDVNTIPGFAFDRVAHGLSMPGVIEVKEQIAIGVALEDLVILIKAGNEEDFKDQVRFVPIR